MNTDPKEQADNLLFLSGMLPIEGRKAARLAALKALAVVRAFCGAMRLPIT